MRTPKFIVTYNGKNITSDITRYLIDLSVSDVLSGESDEVSIQLEDSEGRWRGPWYPMKKDKITVSLGYDDELYDFGTFEVDEIEHSGPPDKIDLRAIAAGISKQMRTRKSQAHEGKTLKGIAQAVAESNGLELMGEIRDISIRRVTQNRETDLSFLKRMADMYGYVFTVRDNKLIFSSIYEVDASEVVNEIDREDLISYSIKDGSAGTKTKSTVTSWNEDEESLITSTTNADEFSAGANYGIEPYQEELLPEVESAKQGVIIFLRSQGVSEDEINRRLNVQQEVSADSFEGKMTVYDTGAAEQTSAAALYNANSHQIAATLVTQGSAKLMAGVTIMLTGMGRVSGKFTIGKVIHKISKGGGYTCDIDAHKVGSLDDPAKEIQRSKR